MGTEGSSEAPLGPQASETIPEQGSESWGVHVDYIDTLSGLDQIGHTD